MIADNFYVSHVYSNVYSLIQTYSTGAIKEKEKSNQCRRGVKLAVKLDVEARLFSDTEEDWLIEKEKVIYPWVYAVKWH